MRLEGSQCWHVKRHESFVGQLADRKIMPVRIYDLAKKLGIESKVVLAKAKELGIAPPKSRPVRWIKSPLNSLNKNWPSCIRRRAAAAVPAPPPELRPLPPPAPIPLSNPTPAHHA